ncbi:asparagine synthetase B family protein [Halosimplex marinum]|uniref:asparagine synthetase B family protein n=1 Tax=Halosimplex marinum TaxID=3396620 RepID=UPI003F579562
MSGIAAVVSDAEDRTDIAALLRPMRYRGIDGVDHVRLDDAELGHLHHDTHPNERGATQPVEVDGAWVTVDGRVDNRERVLDALPSSVQGAVGDAELIGHAYDRWGIDCLSALVGAYAVAIWDADRERLYCARDKTGIRSLYYAVTGADELLVASEVGAIRAIGTDWPVNEGLVGEYLLGDVVTTGETFYDGIRSVRPGEYVAYDPGADRGSVESVRYWPTSEDARPEPDGDAAAAFDALLRRAVRDRGRAADPQPVMMSGGIDSTAVAAYLAEAASEPVPAYSVVFPDREEITEESTIDALAADTDVAVTKIRETAALRSSRRRRWLLPDHPCIDSTSFVYESVFDRVPRGRRVLLTGLGGNLFDGSPVALSDMLADREFRRFARTVRNGSLSVPVALAYALVPLVTTRDAERLLDGRWYPPWPDWLEPSFAERVDLAARFRSEAPSDPFRRASDRRIVRDLRDPYMDFAADSARRLALRHGVELRHPWMDARLVEFLLGLDSASLYCGGTYKRLFRRATADVLPRPVRRQGVSENAYSAVVRDRLAADGDPDRRPLADVDALGADSPAEALSGGDRDGGLRAWRWLTAAAFLDS